ncbi:uncharacterized protein LOC111358551 [Spodoptera litura]|uniref:Uncharacterized protein LOC111358551 n=1 Tax=Spodoptera litura TaxID=69820 RepID=A0A9J7EJK4_SPOLT|nr:uncharacterized protein LOC111358551 [Spodoptera litura]
MDIEMSTENTGAGEEVEVSENHDKEAGQISTIGETVTDEGDRIEVVEGTEGEGTAEVGEVVEGETGGEAAITEEVDGEHIEPEGVLEGEQVEGEEVEGETAATEGEHVEGEHVEGEEKEKGEDIDKVEGEEVAGEGLEGEQMEGEEIEKTGEEGLVPEEQVEEEEQYVEEPPPDPAAPYDFSDSKEALKAPFELRPDQLAEVEQLWEMFQNYTPAYAELDGFITEKELIFMLKSLLIMTYTTEQLQELVTYCCRPPNADGHIFYEQFLKMVTIRQRDFPIEEEIRASLQVYDPEKTGILDREYLRDVLTKQGSKMSPRTVDNLIKEVDISNDGTINLEDIVATMCIDLNKEDLQILRAAAYPKGPDDTEEKTQQETELTGDGNEEN